MTEVKVKSKDHFFDLFGDIYEDSLWIAEKLWADGKSFSNIDISKVGLLLRKIVDDTSKGNKLLLLRAHPDLAGKLAIAGKLSDASTYEQETADLGNCTQEEFKQFENFNKQYKLKFGFPFILAIRGYHRTEILNIFEQRLKNEYNKEFQTALEEVHRIAKLRLEDIKLQENF